MHTPSWHAATYQVAQIVKPLGGSTSKPLLAKATDGTNLVVKLPTTKWQCQLLLNEYLAGLLLARLGISTPIVATAEIPPGLLDHPNLEVRSALQQAELVCSPLFALGTHFADGYCEVGAGGAAQVTPTTVRNLEDVAGAVVFDTWVFNQDARHFLGRHTDGYWHLLLFDNDGAFNRHDWCLHDLTRCDMNCTPLRDWARDLLAARDLEMFDRYLHKLEDPSSWRDLHAVADVIPEAWKLHLMAKRSRDLDDLLSLLDTRRTLTRGILSKGCGPKSWTKLHK